MTFQVTAKATRGALVPVVRAPAPPGEAPTEFRIFARGDNPSDDGNTYVYNEISSKHVIAQWKRRKLRLHIDFEHASEEKAADGEIAVDGAPAIGWFDLEDRPDGLYAVNVEWKEPALTYLKDGRYKYFSPVFFHGGEKHGYVIGALKSLALTNIPRLDDLVPLAAKSVTAAKAGPVGYKRYDLDDSKSWDASKETKAWLAVCTDENGETDWAKYALMFADVTGDGDKTSDYHLPHHSVHDGRLKTSRAGVIAAGNAVQGARGGLKSVPKADLPAIKKHLEKHYHEFDLEAPWEKDESKMKSILHLSKNLALSHEQVQQVVNEALSERFATKNSEGVTINGPWAQDVYDDRVIYLLDGKTYEIGYSLDGDAATLTGEPVEVIRTYTTAAKQPTEAPVTDETQEDMKAALKAHGEALKAHGEALKSCTDSMKVVGEMMKAEGEERRAARAKDDEEKKAKAKADEEAKAKAEEDKKAAEKKAKAEDPDEPAEGDDEKAKAVQAKCKALIDAAVQGQTPAITPAQARDLKIQVKAKKADETYVTTFLAEAVKAKTPPARQETPVADPVFKFSEKTIAKSAAAPATAFKDANASFVPAGKTEKQVLDFDLKNLNEFTLAACKSLQRLGEVTDKGVTKDFSKIYDAQAVQKNWEANREADAEWRPDALVINLPRDAKVRELSGAPLYG